LVDSSLFGYGGSWPSVIRFKKIKKGKLEQRRKIMAQKSDEKQRKIIERYCRIYGVPTATAAQIFFERSVKRLGLVSATRAEEAGSDFFERNRGALQEGLALANEMAKKPDSGAW